MSKKGLAGDNLLTPERMLYLYSVGAFPMADGRDSEEVDWHLPEIRTIIPLDAVNIPRSLRAFMRAAPFEYRFDTCFEDVVAACASRPETWISHKLVDAYRRLLTLGHVHTVEVWEAGRLVGGLYGITFKGAFFGESMFSLRPQASKCALVTLVNHLNEKGFTLLDVQYQTDHLRMFGTIEIPFDDYARRLAEAYERDCRF